MPNKYVPPTVDLGPYDATEGYSGPYGQPYAPPSTFGHATEQAFANGFGGLFGCGTSMICLILALALSVVLNWYLLSRFFKFLPDLTTALASLKEAVNAKRT